MKEYLLIVEDLSIQLQNDHEEQQLLDHVSFVVPTGEIVAIIGESGSGKSITAKAMLNLLPKGMAISSGKIEFNHKNVLTMNKKQRQFYRGTQVGFVFQDTSATFDALRTIGQHFLELFSTHTELSKKEVKERAIRLLEDMQLQNAENVYESYPFELSGGMRQRVQLALALALNPLLLIADEPTTALDSRIQAEVLHLIKDWSTRTGGSVLFITHDLGVVAEMADYVVVLKNGTVVETAPVVPLFDQPVHEHTKQLLHYHRELTNIREQLNQAVGGPLVTVENVGKAYFKKKWFRKQSIQAVRDVSFHIQKGEIVGLIGESGSGKSTLSRLLLQLEPYEQGKITWHGDPPFRKGVQWVHQDPLASFDPRWNVEKIVGEGLDYWKEKSDNKHKKVKEVLQKVGLHEKICSVYPYELSGGMKQRVAIARALLLEPELLILDEPFASLDMSSQARMLSLLQEINKKGKTAILFISHDIRAAMALCHRILVMDDGRIVEEANANELSSSINFYTNCLLSSMLTLHPSDRIHEKNKLGGKEYAIQKN
ncbi:nickel ABC transporter ATP-binding protein NikE [Peribacillus huizhouensis]|uniref:Peptide/nickel transport system ATP-binding protein n=1 Tax=Peribacillus huizhouensis TaxID=1501239 RepID=A0ABR6CPI0_9BACI|nr:ABC transporter ATP-binding protein [Peribacillus huizhouensis]MBA9026844.1 peptide/nickel transport system ATP-binding protein [Peribacillus huizhouensis]